MLPRFQNRIVNNLEVTLTQPPNRVPLADIPKYGSWAFLGFGALATVGGVFLTFQDPAGLVLIAFGLVFAGAGFLIRRLFGTPAGKKAIVAESHSRTVSRLDGAGTRSRATVLHVDADATDEEVAAAREAWASAQLRQRPDWVSGRVEEKGRRSRGIVQAAAVLWFALAIVLGVLGATVDQFFLFAAALVGVAAVALVFVAIRQALRERAFGASTFVMERTPAHLGETLRGRVITGVGVKQRAAVDFEVRLQCVDRWEETRHSGRDDRTSRPRRDILWKEQRTTRGVPDQTEPRLVVGIEFDLPMDVPATTLGGSNEGVVWELEVSASLPGLDYVAEFDFPVVAPPES